MVKNSLCILIRRPPYGQIHAAEAIRHIGGALAEGIQTSVVLIDDGVYVARDGQEVGNTAWTSLIPPLAKAMAKGAHVYLHTPSAQTRGLLNDAHFIRGVEHVDDRGLARLLTQNEMVMVY